MSRAIEHFVQTLWQFVGSNNLPNVADDNVRPARIPGTAVHPKLRSVQDITSRSFPRATSSPRSSKASSYPMSQFEDDTLESIRLNLALPSGGGGLGGEASTLRQAAADVYKRGAFLVS